MLPVGAAASILKLLLIYPRFPALSDTQKYRVYIPDAETALCGIENETR